MVSVTSRYVTTASRYQSCSSMYIEGPIPRNSNELAEAFPIETLAVTINLLELCRCFFEWSADGHVLFTCNLYIIFLHFFLHFEQSLFRLEYYES